MTEEQADVVIDLIAGYLYANNFLPDQESADYHAQQLLRIINEQR